MNVIANALEQIRAEIQQIQSYLVQLQETEQQLAKLETARSMVLGTVIPRESVPTTYLGSQEPSTELATSPTKHSLPFNIIKVLSTTNRAMSLAELQRELNKIRGPVQKNALSSTLTRLVVEHRIKRPKTGHYAAMGPEDLNEETATLRRDSMPSLAYTVLREAEKPLTTDEIWASVRARKPNASKHSLIGSLYYYSKIGRIFTHTDERTFGLREWQNRQIENPRMSAASETPRPIEGNLLQGVQGKPPEKNHNIPYREGQSFRAHTLQTLAVSDGGMTLPELTEELRRAGRDTTLKKVSSLVYRLIEEERVQKRESGKFAVRNQQKGMTATLNDHGLSEETSTQEGGPTGNDGDPMSLPHEEDHQVEWQDETPQQREESEDDSRLFSE